MANSEPVFSRQMGGSDERRASPVTLTRKSSLQSNLNNLSSMNRDDDGGLGLSPEVSDVDSETTASGGNSRRSSDGADSKPVSNRSQSKVTSRLKDAMAPQPQVAEEKSSIRRASDFGRPTGLGSMDSYDDK
jgi:hypothetical protein